MQLMENELTQKNEKIEMLKAMVRDNTLESNNYV
jgi:hypothetical protein